MCSSYNLSGTAQMMPNLPCVTTRSLIGTFDLPGCPITSYVNIDAASLLQLSKCHEKASVKVEKELYVKLVGGWGLIIPL